MKRRAVRSHRNKSMKKNMKKSMKLRRGGSKDEYVIEYSNYGDDMPNNRNNLPYYPYIARGSLNSGFQYGDILMNDYQDGGKRYKKRKGGTRRKTMKKYKTKRGGDGCGGQSRESWFRGAYPVLML